MKRLINFFKKLFGCTEVCPKCKSNPCKCEPEVPAEHVRTVEPAPIREEVPTCEFRAAPVEEPVKVEVPVEEPKEEVKAAPKKKRTPRKKKVESEKK